MEKHVVEGQKRDHTFGQPDLFIAAIAALQDLVVVSRDVSEFCRSWRAGIRSLGERAPHQRWQVALKAPATAEALENFR